MSSSTLLKKTYYNNKNNNGNNNQQKNDQIKKIIQTISATYSKNIPFCTEIDASKIKFKKIDYKSSYPYFEEHEQVQPIIFKTEYFTLVQNAISYNKFTKTYVVNFTRSLEKNDEGIDNLFNTLRNIDKFMIENKDEILKDFKDNKLKQNVQNNDQDKQQNITSGRKYNPLVKIDITNGTEKFRAFMNTIKSNNNDTQRIRIFYKDNDLYKYSTNRFKEFTYNGLTHELTRGTKVRLIININKIWCNLDEYGVSLKIMQLEIDDSLIDKFQILNKLETNKLNMFGEMPVEVNANINKEYDNMLRKSQYGLNKSLTNASNNKMINILRNEDMKSMFGNNDYEILDI